MPIFVRAFLCACGIALATAHAETPLAVGSKRFTESYILGEIVTQAATRAGAAAVHKPGLGNTAILRHALEQGAIDAYPEYTGTIAREILGVESPLGLADIQARLVPLGFGASVPFGFSDSYGIGVRGAVARALGLETLSQLAAHPELRFGLSHEFLGRNDGWPGLRAAYGLRANARALDHGLAYAALAAGEVDAIDVYTTDAHIGRDGIVVLRDDRHFFPRYDALLLHRADAPALHPAAWKAIAQLQGRIDEPRMIALNARAEIDGRDFASIAREFLGDAGGARRTLMSALFAADTGRLLAQHVGLVLASLALAIAIGVPLGILSARRPRAGQAVLLTTGLLQTIPSLALLAMLIPLTGMIGALPAIIALFLYALLPIVRNTYTGLREVRPSLREAALALGLVPRDVLREIELPLALPTILAGVKTAAVVNVGTATIAAFIGAGGFGERIAQGLALNDNVMLLAGALPAAALALVVHFALEAVERRAVSTPRAR